MHGLSVRVVPIYEEEVGGNFPSMTAKAINSGIKKLISPGVEAKSPDVPWDKPVKSILKW